MIVSRDNCSALWTSFIIGIDEWLKGLNNLFLAFYPETVRQAYQYDWSLNFRIPNGCYSTTNLFIQIL